MFLCTSIIDTDSSKQWSAEDILKINVCKIVEIMNKLQNQLVKMANIPLTTGTTSRLARDKGTGTSSTLLREKNDDILSSLAGYKDNGTSSTMDRENSAGVSSSWAVDKDPGVSSILTDHEDNGTSSLLAVEKETIGTNRAIYVWRTDGNPVPSQLNKCTPPTSTKKRRGKLVRICGPAASNNKRIKTRATSEREKRKVVFLSSSDEKEIKETDPQDEEGSSGQEEETCNKTHGIRKSG